jgi:hypothetical protein
MGRYRRPSICRYCYGSGHTKRACPQMRKDAADGDGYAQNMVERYADRAKSRKCSYCNEGGHNKTGCTIRKGHRVIYQKTLNDFTENVTYRSATAGIKVGSLITVTLRSNKKVTAIIERIDINKRAPDYRWLNNHYKTHLTGQTEENLQHYEAYQRYNNSLKESLNAATMFMRSLTGNGLGYWNDSETGMYEVCDILRNIEGTSENSDYEVVSAA